MSLLYPYGALTSCKKLKKSLEQSLEIFKDGPTDGQTDGQGRLLRTSRVNPGFNRKGESEWQNEQVLSMTQQLEAVMCEL